MAVSDDGEAFRDGSPEISIEELLDFDDEEHHHDLGEEEILETFSAPEDGPHTSPEYDLLMRCRLDRLDKEALAIMSKGYFRHVGNVHFESAMHSVDHWDSWDQFRGEVSGAFAWEKRRFREWKRPSASIMIVKYGLMDLYHFAEMVHSAGDQVGCVVEIGSFDGEEEDDGDGDGDVGEDDDDIDGEVDEGPDLTTLPYPELLFANSLGWFF